MNKYTVKKVSLYTGKTIAKETFTNIDEAIKFCNNNISVSGAYRWVLSFKSIAI